MLKETRKATNIMMRVSNQEEDNNYNYMCTQNRNTPTYDTVIKYNHKIVIKTSENCHKRGNQQQWNNSGRF